MKIAKILSIALCLIMLLSLTACFGGIMGDSDDEYKEPTTVKEYVEKVNEAMANAKVKITSTETKTINGIKAPDETTVIYVDGKKSMSEDGLGTKTIIIDDTVFFLNETLGLKKKLTGAAAKAYAATIVLGIDETNSGAGAYKNSSFEKNSDGTVSLIFSSTSDGFNNLVDNITGGIGVPGGIELGESSQVVVIDKNYKIVSITQSDESSTTVGSMTTEIIIEKSKMFKYDDTISVTAPADADDFQEIASIADLYN